MINLVIGTMIGVTLEYHFKVMDKVIDSVLTILTTPKEK